MATRRYHKIRFSTGEGFVIWEGTEGEDQATKTRVQGIMIHTIMIHVDELQEPDSNYRTWIEVIPEEMPKFYPRECRIDRLMSRIIDELAAG